MDTGSVTPAVSASNVDARQSPQAALPVSTLNIVAQVARGPPDSVPNPPACQAPSMGIAAGYGATQLDTDQAASFSNVSARLGEVSLSNVSVPHSSDLESPLIGDAADVADVQAASSLNIDARPPAMGVQAASSLNIDARPHSTLVEHVAEQPLVQQTVDPTISQPRIHCRHGNIHQSHTMLATRNFVFCGRCGCYASSDLRKDSQLYQPCAQAPRSSHARLIRNRLMEITEPTVPRLTFTGRRALLWDPSPSLPAP